MSEERKKIGIIRLYCGNAGEMGYYNLQEVGLAKEYVKHNYIVYIFMLQKGNKKTYYKEINKDMIVVYPATCHLLNHGLFPIKILKELKIDLVHLNSDNQLFVPIVLNYCRKNNIAVYNYVGMLYSYTHNRLKNMFSGICSRINRVCYNKYPTVVKNEHVKKQLADKGVENVVVAPVGLDVDGIPKDFESKEELRKALHLPIDKKIILFVGRMHEEKRPFDAIELMGNLSEDYVLVMIGDGRLNSSVEEMIDKKNLKSRVYRILKVPNNEMYKYYRSADYFLNLTLNEIWGMCILEAMYNRCIVIAVKAPGPNMIIADRINGFLVDDLKEIKLILEDSNTCNKEVLIENAYKEVCNKYLWKHSYIKIEEFRKNYK